MEQNSQYTEEILSNLKVITRLSQGILVAIPRDFGINCALCKLVETSHNSNCSHFCIAPHFIYTHVDGIYYSTFILTQEIEDRYLRGEIIIPEIGEDFKLPNVIYRFPIVTTNHSTNSIQEPTVLEYDVIREDDYGVLVRADTCDRCLYTACSVHDDPCNMCLRIFDNDVRYLTKIEELRYNINKQNISNGTS